MRRTALYYDPIYLEHDTGQGHPERAQRLSAIMAALSEHGIYEALDLRSPREATVDEIELVHPRGYIEGVERLSRSGGGYLDMDTAVSDRTFDAALKAAGANLDAVDGLMRGDLDNAFCLVRPPGHHALPAKGMGFCIFDNLAIACRYAMREYGLERILVLDWDAHHGNGIQDTFYDDNRVLYVSLHQYPHYPGSGSSEETGRDEGAGFTVNFPMPASSGEEVYLTAFERVILPIAHAYKPQMVMIASGLDAHYADPLCMLRLTALTYARMALRLQELAAELCEGRLMASLEGGYGLEGISASMVNIMAAFLDSDIRVDDSEGAPEPQRWAQGIAVIEETGSYHARFWPI
jgi:acetoin utilization deacetylase AcuC-like enzyme